MSLPEQRPFQRGNARGVVMDFAQSGDTLPMHDHVDGAAHITAVLLGEIEIRYTDKPAERYAAGRVIDPAYPHEIVAIAAGSRIMNIQK